MIEGGLKKVFIVPYKHSSVNVLKLHVKCVSLMSHL